MYFSGFAASVLAIFILTSAAHAASVIFDSEVLLEDVTDAIKPDFDASAFFGGQSLIRAANEFSLDEKTVVGSLSFTGLYANANTPEADIDNFSVYVYQYSGGDVGALAHTLAITRASRTDTGLDFINQYDIYSYNLDVVDLELAAGDYFLSLVNDTSSDVDDSWFWTLEFDRQGAAGSFDSGANWSALNSRMDFTIFGADMTPVPLPAGLPLMLVGLGALGAAGIRRKPESLQGRQI